MYLLFRAEMKIENEPMTFGKGFYQEPRFPLILGITMVEVSGPNFGLGLGKIVSSHFGTIFKFPKHFQGFYLVMFFF